MAIQVSGTTVVDNSRNLVNITAGTFSGTGYVKIPAGTEAQRPTSAVNGMIRYNTTTNEFEGYKDGRWDSLGGNVQSKAIAMSLIFG